MARCTEICRTMVLVSCVLSTTTAVIKDTPPTVEDMNTRREITYEETDNEVTLECVVFGSPKPHITWIHNETSRLPESLMHDPSEANQYKSLLRLQIDKTNPRSIEGVYRCFANNSMGTAASDNMIVTMELPDMDEIPTPAGIYAGDAPCIHRDFDEGNSILLDCSELPSSDASFGVNWYKYARSESDVPSNLQASTCEEVIEDYSDYATADLDQGRLLKLNKNKQLLISHAVASDEGLYECKGRRKYIHYHLQMRDRGSAAQGTPVTKKPKLLTLYSSPDMITTLINTPLRITCISNGYPSGVVSWTKPDNSTGEVKYENNKRELLINNSGLADAGDYTCRITNHGGEASKTTTVVVESPPIKESLSRSLDVTGDKPLTLVCKVKAVPAASVTWYHNTQEIPREGDPHWLYQDGGQELHTESVEAQHAGNLACNVSNKLGYLYHNMYLTVTMPVIPVMITTPHLAVGEHMVGSPDSDSDKKEKDLKLLYIILPVVGIVVIVVAVVAVVLLKQRMRDRQNRLEGEQVNLGERVSDVERDVNSLKRHKRNSELYPTKKLSYFRNLSSPAGQHLVSNPEDPEQAVCKKDKKPFWRRKTKSTSQTSDCDIQLKTFVTAPGADAAKDGKQVDVGVIQEEDSKLLQNVPDDKNLAVIPVGERSSLVHQERVDED